MATILVFEDDMGVRMLVEKVFRLKGHDVRAFEDAGPALESVDLDAIDLIVTDYNMPTRGDLAIKEIRNRGYDVPVIVMSGYLDCGIVAALEDLDVARILEKPVSPFALSAVVEEVLSRPFEMTCSGG